MIHIIGNQNGFPEIGGIRKIAILAQNQLNINKHTSAIANRQTKNLHQSDFFIFFGCSSIWAYLQVVKILFVGKSKEIHWIPCYHPPEFVKNKKKARLALYALRTLQKFGISVYALSDYESKYLDNGRCHVISLPFEHEKNIYKLLRSGNLRDKPIKKYDLVFLGRPTEQKGWSRFCYIAEKTKARSLAMLPYEPTGNCPKNLEIEINLSDACIFRYLEKCKILILPSDYESFGFAQSEALLAGCLVPILGMWPLWVGTTELDWRSYSNETICQQIQSLLTSESQVRKAYSEQLANWLSVKERYQECLPKNL